MNWKRILAAAALLMAALPATLWGAERPAFDRVLPAATPAFVSIAHVQDVQAAWNETRLGELGKEPAMKPFLDAARARFDDALGDLRDVADISLADLQAAASGEVCLAAVETSAGRLAMAALVDVDGEAPRVRELIEKIDAGLKRRGASYATRAATGGVVHSYSWKARDGAARRSAYFVKADLLVVSNDLAVAELLLSRSGAETDDGLASVTAYHDVMERCTAAAGGLAPQVRWYLDPFGYSRLASGDDPEFAIKHGFDAVKGVGGTVNFDAPDCEILTRVAVYAPPPHEKAMRLAALLDAPSHAPPPWVLDDVDSYLELNLNLATVVDSVGGLFDDVVAEGIAGTFEDILDDLKSVDGPGVDIRSELLPIIGPRVVVVSDSHGSAKAGSSHMLIAIATADEVKAADVVKRLMRDDPDVSRHTMSGYKYELFQVDDKEDVTMPNMGMMVANGYILVADNAALIRKLLLAPGDAPKLGASMDFSELSAQMAELGADGASARIFSRPTREFAATYELLRAGKLDDLESLDAELLRRLFGDNDRRLPGLPKLDFSKLPPFETVGPYLSPQGIFVKNQPNGWLIVGFIP
jgi:hypothetical protein